MKITDISVQAKDNNRVNVFVDGKYDFSLSISQLADLGVKAGQEYNADEIAAFKKESDFGKVYGRALDYCLMRPRSVREVSDYLYRKTRPVRDSKGGMKPGLSIELKDRVLEKLTQKEYVDDEKFTRYWVENRSLKKGTSLRKLKTELLLKGVESEIIERVINESGRNDIEELNKVIAKKHASYPDKNKLIRYLASLGFRYDDIKNVLD